MRTVDLIVIGAGPAGMAAAAEAAGAGLAVVMLDEQPGPGGQIYRAVTGSGAARREVLGADYLDGARLVEAMRQAGAEQGDEAAGREIAADEPDGEAQCACQIIVPAEGHVASSAAAMSDASSLS